MQTRNGGKFGRRARDRLVTRDGTDTERLGCDSRVEAHILLADEELRDTASALGLIEDFLVRALEAMERTDAEALSRLAREDRVLEEAELLSQTVEQLQHRLLRVAMGLSGPPGGREP